jgi:5'-phosphate synthase pdxT subunit
MIYSENSSKNTIGVLDLQGGVCEHLDHLERLGIANRRVKEPSDLMEFQG